MITKQASFLLHENDKQLDECIFRYAMMLSLKNIYPAKKLVAASDVDLVWSVHKLKHLLYQQDLERMKVKDVNFINSFEETGNELANHTQQTTELWEKTFQTPYTLPIAFKASPQFRKNGAIQMSNKDNPYFKRNGVREDINKDNHQHKENKDGEEIKTRIATATIHNQRFTPHSYIKMGTTRSFKQLTTSLPSLYPVGDPYVPGQSTDSTSTGSLIHSISPPTAPTLRKVNSSSFRSEASFTPKYDFDEEEDYDMDVDEHDRSRSRSRRSRQYYSSEVNVAGHELPRSLTDSRDDIVRAPSGQVLYRSHVIHLVPLDASSLNPELLCLSPSQLASFTKGTGYSMVIEIELKIPKKYNLEDTKLTIHFKDLCNSEEVKVVFPGDEDLKGTDFDAHYRKKILKYKALVPGYLFFPEDKCGFAVQAYLSIGNKMYTDLTTVNHSYQSYSFHTRSQIDNISFNFSSQKLLKMTILKGKEILEKPVHKVFRIKKGDFESLSVHPKDLGKVLGPMNLEDLPELTSEVPLWLATHNVIQEHTGADTGISVRVIHCLDLLLSVVQIIVDNRVVITAHTVGTELVNKHKSKLNIGDHLSNLVWRAMVLKDCFGETSLVFGAWTNQVNNKKRPFIDHGHCSYAYLNLRKDEVRKFELKLQNEHTTTIDLGGSQLNFMKGEFTSTLAETDLLHKLGLGFVTSVLYLLIEPVPLKSSHSDIISLLPELAVNDSSEMLLASGWSNQEEGHNIPSIMNMLQTLFKGSNLFESLAINRYGHDYDEVLKVASVGNNREESQDYYPSGNNHHQVRTSSSSSVKILNDGEEDASFYIRGASVDRDIDNPENNYGTLDKSAVYSYDDLWNTSAGNYSRVYNNNKQDASERFTEIMLKEEEILKAEETEEIATDPFVTADEIINIDEVNHQGLDEVDNIVRAAQDTVNRADKVVATARNPYKNIHVTINGEIVKRAANAAIAPDVKEDVSSENSHQMSTTKNEGKRRVSKVSEVSMFDDDNTCEMLI